MSDQAESLPQPQAWRAVAALNAVSALAQIGQYGIAFVLYPLALQARGLPAWQIGAVSSAIWVGMLLGLVTAPRLVARFGYGAAVGTGLGLSSLALLMTPALPITAWALAAAICGVGLGWRWIGNETWLYGIVASASRGRIVGLHEALISIAAVAGPALIALLGVVDHAAFAAAAFFSAVAAAPLWWARGSRLPLPARRPRRPWTAARLRSTSRAFLSLGAVMAGVGGLIEGALLGLFPVYAAERGLDTAQTAWLLSIFGLGAMLLQLPLGWMADAYGLRRSAWLAALTVAACALILSVGRPGDVAFAVLMLLLGGALAGFLTLGLIAAAKTTDPAQLADEVSRVSIAFTGLSVLGPLLAGALASAAGGRSLMVFVCVAALVLSGLIGKLAAPRE